MACTVIIVLLALLAIMLWLCINLLVSLATIRRLDHYLPQPRAEHDWPLISVLIPARNEAQTIGRCVESLLAQQYPRLEIIVLNDESTDATAAIVHQLAESDPLHRLSLIAGKPLPMGWLGKCYACNQLAQAAHGDYLLFTDADTVHGSESAAHALALAEKFHLGLVSVLPRQLTASWSEHLLIPLLPFNILALLPVAAVSRRPEPAFSAGIGQFLFFRRGAYVAAGGHAAVRDQVLDDVTLARRVKVAGWKMDLVDGGKAVECRMYTSFAEIWQGFSKNLYDFHGRSPIAVYVALTLRTLLSFLPPVLFIIGAVVHWQSSILILCGTLILIPIVMRILIAWRLGTARSSLWYLTGWLAALMYIVAEAIHCAILYNSMRWGQQGNMVWKGRSYPKTSIETSEKSQEVTA